MFDPSVPVAPMAVPLAEVSRVRWVTVVDLLPGCVALALDADREELVRLSVPGLGDSVVIRGLSPDGRQLVLTFAEQRFVHRRVGLYTLGSGEQRWYDLAYPAGFVLVDF